MVRWIIWSQVVFALIGSLATLADQGDVPPYLFPPGPVLLLCFLSAFVSPIVVINMGKRWEPGSGRWGEVVASVGLGLITIYAMFPWVQ